MKMWKYLEVKTILQKSVHGDYYRAEYSKSMAVSGFDTLAEVFDYFGQEGWELVGSFKKDIYTFKMLIV